MPPSNTSECSAEDVDNVHEATTGEECPICKEPMEEDDTSESPTITECGHTFGVACLTLWLSSHNTCPMCRTQLHELLPTDDDGFDGVPDLVDDGNTVADIDSQLAYLFSATEFFDFDMQEQHDDSDGLPSIASTIWHSTALGYPSVALQQSDENMWIMFEEMLSESRSL